LKLFDFPKDEYELLTEFTIPGQPGRKSNSRQIVINQKTGKPMVIKSKSSIAYAEYFLINVPAEARQNWGSLEDHLAIRLVIYYASMRPDVSDELIKDLLEKSGVVKNDRYIRAGLVFGLIDKEKPRTELRIYRVR